MGPSCLHPALLPCAWILGTRLSEQGDVSPKCPSAPGRRVRRRGPRAPRGAVGKPPREQVLSVIQPRLPLQAPLRPLHPGLPPAILGLILCCLLLTPYSLSPTGRTTVPQGPQTGAPSPRAPALSGPHVTSLKLHLRKPGHPATEEAPAEEPGRGRLQRWEPPRPDASHTTS